MKRLTILLLIIAILCIPLSSYATKGAKYSYFSRFGDRNEARVAVTVDDWWEPELLPEFIEVANKYGVVLTCYPSGCNLHEKDRERWQMLLDAGGEIGSHGYAHERMRNYSAERFQHEYERFSKALDEALGYHYEFLTIRLPYGAATGSSGGCSTGRALHAAGFDHAVFWDWDKTTSVSDSLKHIKNGSIILVHANRHDLEFLDELLAALAERNYEYVTITELLHITTRLVDDEPEGSVWD